MSPKQPSKQKRAAQNRAQRAAREARKAAASTPAGSRASSGGAGRGGGGLLSRLRGSGRTSSAAAAAGPGRRPSLAEARAMQPPGYRAALSAVFAAVAAIVLLFLFLTVPVDARGLPYTSETLVADWVATAIDVAQQEPGLTAAELAESIDTWSPDRDTRPWAQVQWPLSITLVLPLIGAGLAFWAVRRRSSSKVLNRAMYATLFGSILSMGAVYLFIPVVLAVGVAMFQVRKAEVQALAAGGADDGVIDVDSEELGAQEDEVDLDADDDGEDASDDLDEDGIPAGAGDVEVIDAMVIERAEVEADAAADPDRKP